MARYSFGPDVMKKTIAIVLVGAAVLAAYAKMSGGKATEVKTIRAEHGPLVASLRASGQIVAGRQSVLSSEVPAQVVRVFAKVGENVTNGAALAQLESTEIDGRLRVAEAKSAELRAALVSARQREDALKQIWRAGGESKSNVDQADTSVKELQARYSSALAEVKTAQQLRSKLTIRAPYPSVIIDRDLAEGEVVAPGKMLFTLADAAQKEIEATIDQGDAAQIQLGQEVAISSDAYPGRSWTERVLRVNPSVSRNDTTGNVIIRLSLGPAAPPLRIGQQIDAQIRTAYRAAAWKVPFEAIVRHDDGEKVIVIRDGKAVFIPVRSGIEDTTHSEIVQGVNGGEVIVLAEGKSIQPGQRLVAAAAASRQ